MGQGLGGFSNSTNGFRKGHSGGQRDGPPVGIQRTREAAARPGERAVEPAKLVELVELMEHHHDSKPVPCTGIP